MRRIAVLTAVLATLIVVPADAHGRHHARHHAHAAAVVQTDPNVYPGPAFSEAEWRVEMSEAGFSSEEINELDQE